MKQKERRIHLEGAIRAESESTLILLLTLSQRVSPKAEAGNVAKARGSDGARGAGTADLP